MYWMLVMFYTWQESLVIFICYDLEVSLRTKSFSSKKKKPKKHSGLTEYPGGGHSLLLVFTYSWNSSKCYLVFDSKPRGARQTGFYCSASQWVHIGIREVDLCFWMALPESKRGNIVCHLKKAVDTWCPHSQLIELEENAGNVTMTRYGMLIGS